VCSQKTNRGEELYVEVDALALPDVNSASQHLALNLDGQVLAALCF
jgi:hypothetical protein